MNDPRDTRDRPADVAPSGPQDAGGPETRPAPGSSPVGPAGGPDGASAPLDLDRLRQTGARDDKGRWQRGNLSRLKHGLRVAPDHPALRVTFEDRRQAIERDLGDDLPTLKAAAVREAARLTVIVEGLGEDLMSRGVLSPKGNQRAALSAYVTALDRLHRLMTLLGLERRQKPTAQRLEDYIDGGAR